MKNSLSIVFRRVIRLLSRLLFIFPVKHNRYFFESFNGTAYACNPKYLSEYISSKGDAEIIWSLNDPQKYDIPNVIKVRNKSLKWFYYKVTSEILVTNTTPNTLVPLRSTQLSINTWHAGGAYKRTGFSGRNSTRVNTLDEWRRQMADKQFNLYLSSSESFTKYNIKEAYDYHGEIINSGMPRNDIFFDPDMVKEKSRKVREYFSINGIVVLYAPTYRGEFNNSDAINIEFPYKMVSDILHRRFQQDVSILVRTHYSDNNSNLSEDATIIDASFYPDMQELLCATDILVTDYSSSIWDFSLMERPSFLFVPDLKNYEKDDRGFFITIDDWPAYKCESIEELEKCLLTYTANDVSNKAKAHKNLLNSYEKGNASEQIYRRIKTSKERKNG